VFYWQVDKTKLPEVIRLEVVTVPDLSRTAAVEAAAAAAAAAVAMSLHRQVDNAQQISGLR
jgi:hypothetical protein